MSLSFILSLWLRDICLDWRFYGWCGMIGSNFILMLLLLLKQIYLPLLYILTLCRWDFHCFIMLHLYAFIYWHFTNYNYLVIVIQIFIIWFLTIILLLILWRINWNLCLNLSIIWMLLVTFKIRYNLGKACRWILPKLFYVIEFIGSWFCWLSFFILFMF